ncbi:MAG: peptide chain release factor 1 [Candidatus Hydrothermarchaeota archaeon]|nr:MAG: peptide chain release factor 1 [Candidatus Hydrothermarchaeota archaeon]
MSKSYELHKLKKEIELLEAKKGRGTELISLYIPPDKNLADVMNQMRQEYSQAMNIKSARTRKNVQSALEVIMQRLKLFKKPPEKGMVLFVGTIPHGTKDKMEVYIIEPPEKIKTYIYHCNSQFLLDPIKETLEDKKTYGLLVVDRNEATIGLLKGKHIEIVKRITSNVPRKHGRGGQSQRRFERLIEIAAHEYFKRVGERANEIFLNTPDLEGVLIGGPGPTKEFFLEQDYLHHEIKKKVIDVIDVSYTNDFGIRELVENASQIFKDLDIMKEKKLVQRFLKEVVKDYGLATYGEKEVREALQLGSVEILLISEGVESYRVKIVCAACGYREERTVKNLKAFEIQLENQECKNCGEKALSIEEYKSTIDELTELAKQTGVEVEIISTETEEGQQLLAFGGIAALLRFRGKGGV